MVVSVIIPTYNSEKWIGDALKSIFRQSYPDIELIVVDDGSCDRTVSIVKETLASEFKKTWHVIELTTNRGPSVARNVGLRVATAPWVQFLDSDDLLAPTKLALEMASAERAAPSVSAIYSSWRRFYSDDGIVRWAGSLAQPNMEGRHPIMCLVGSDRFLLGAGLIRRTVLEQIGGFSESLRFWECEEIAVRIAKAGPLESVTSTQPLYMWRMHRGKAYIGGQNARYPLAAVAISWIKQLLEVAEYQRLDQLSLSTADQIQILDSCTIWARRLFSADRKAFARFVQLVCILFPKFLPTTPKYTAALARYIGYEYAETITSIIAAPKARASKMLRTMNLRPNDSIFE